MPSMRDAFANFNEYDAPFLVRVRMAVANNLKKARTGKDCCGNLGQPGC